MTTPHVYKKHIASRWFLEDFTRLHLTASCPTACCSALENISKNNESCVVFICLLNTCLSVWIVEKCSSQDFNSSIQKTSDPLPGLMPQNVATLVVVHGASFWIRWGFQALQGCPLSVASESKNCIQIRMVHEETYLKNDASITNQNKFTNFSGQKNTWNVPQPQMKKKCLQLCMIDIYPDLTGKTMDPSQVALVASAPKTRRVHLLWSNHEAVLRKNLPRSPGGFGGGIARVDKLTIHGSLR